MSNIPQSFWEKVEEVRMAQRGEHNHLMLGDDDLHILERWRMERGLYRRVNREWRVKPKDI